MPWCEECSRYWNPPSMNADGTCPTCGRVLAPPAPRVPWHFKLLLFGIVVYLGFRGYQGAEWLAHHL